jgi:large subunit ribosomal protein L24
MLKIHKGDNVQITNGKDRGKSGEVERILTKEHKLIVTGRNVYKRHVKSRQGIEGGIIDIVKPVDVSDVALICPNCKKPTRVGFKIEADSKIRVCRKCGKEIGK